MREWLSLTGACLAVASIGPLLVSIGTRLFRLLRASVRRCGNGFLFSQRPRPVSLWNEVPLTLIARRWPCAFFLSDSKGMLDVKDTVLRRELASIALATRKTKNFFCGMLSAFRDRCECRRWFSQTLLPGHMLSSVSVAWSDISSSIRRSNWLTSGAAGNGAMCNKLKMIALLGKAAGAGSEEPWKKRSPFSHLCNLFLMYSKWQPNYTHCKFGTCFHRWTEFAFSWRTGKQRPRVVHAVTITCLHSKYSFELQRRQAEDPRVVHAMTLAPADIGWRTDREGAHGLGPIWQQPSCTQVRFGVGEKTIEGGHGAYMQWPARTFTVDVCFHWRTVNQSSRVKHAVPQQPVDSNLLALQVFFELQRRQAWEPRVVHPRGVHAMTATWVVEKRAEKPRVVDAMTLTFTLKFSFSWRIDKGGSGPGSYKKW